jgi:hypothetical protein
MSVSQFLKPSTKILESIENLETFYQLTNQKNVKLFFERPSIHKRFKGTIDDYDKLEEITKIMECDGKIWSPLLKSIYLIEAFDSKIDISKFDELTNEQEVELFRIIKDGITARKKIDIWLKEFKGEFDSIKGAVAVDLKYQFQILKLGKLDNYRKSDKGITLYNEIYQITSVDEIIDYVKIQKEQSDCLILTIMKNPRREWKSIFYLFFVYNGFLYSIDNAERRLNLDNVAGDRNPDRWVERAYKDVWLPFFLISDTKMKKSKSKAVQVRGDIYKISTMEDVSKVEIGVIHWLELFMYRVMDRIVTKRIDIGITPNKAIKFLPGKVDKTYEYGRGTDCGFGRNRYLLDKYGKEASKALVLTKDDIPNVVGTQKYIRDVINYKKMSLLADDIQKTVVDNYNKNVNKVTGWIKGFVESYGIENFVIRALEDNRYERDKYSGFGHDWIDGKLVKESEETQKIKEKILRIGETQYCYQDGKMNRLFYFSTDVKNKYKYKCHFCNHNWKLIVNVKFKEYTQFIDFFNIKAKDIPKEMIEHLHQAATWYMGNSILDDIDPVDLIDDPWFSDHTDKVKLDDVWRGSDEKQLEIFVFLCKRCFNRFAKLANFVEKNPRNEVEV